MTDGDLDWATTVDVPSCAALGGQLCAGGSRLRDAGDDDEVARLAEALDLLGRALLDYAEAARRPAPPRPGLPLPRTALKAAAGRVVDLLEAGPGGGPVRRDATGSQRLP